MRGLIEDASLTIFWCSIFTFIVSLGAPRDALPWVAFTYFSAEFSARRDHRRKMNLFIETLLWDMIKGLRSEKESSDDKR